MVLVLNIVLSIHTVVSVTMNCGILVLADTEHLHHLLQLAERPAAAQDRRSRAADAAPCHLTLQQQPP